MTCAAGNSQCLFSVRIQIGNFFFNGFKVAATLLIQLQLVVLQTAILFHFDGVKFKAVKKN